MDEFAIDLDKVLDDFEKSEDSFDKNKPVGTDIKPSFQCPSYTNSVPGLVSQTEPNLYSFQSVNNHYRSRSQQPIPRQTENIDKIDLSEADFSASTSSLTVRSVSATNTSIYDKKVVKTSIEERKSSYPSLYTSFGLNSTDVPQSFSSNCTQSLAASDFSLPASTISNGYVEEEEVLSVHLPVNTDKSEIEIKLIPGGSTSEISNFTICSPKNTDSSLLITNGDHKSNICDAPIEKEPTPSQSPKLIFSPIDETASQSEESKLNEIVKEPEIKVPETLPWEALAVELDIPNIFPKSEVVSFSDLETIDINPEELESYLKDLEDINFTTNEGKGEEESFKVETEKTSVISKSLDTQAVGGARPKVKDTNTRNNKQAVVNKVENINRGEAIIENINIKEVYDVEAVIANKNDKITIEDPVIPVQTESSVTNVEGDISTKALSSPTIERLQDTKEAVPEDKVSLSEDIEVNSCEEVSESTEGSLETSTKLIRPTSLNLPSPLLVSQPQAPPIVEETLALVTTEATPSPELSETDSALPPSPENNSQAENCDNSVSNDIEVKTDLSEPADNQISPAEAVEADSDRPFNEMEPSAQSAAELEYVPELTEEEQLLGKIKPFWIPDEEAPNCLHCDIKFTVLKRRHHCRGCGKVLCAQCCNAKARIPYLEDKEARVCQLCLVILNKVAEVERLYSGSVPEERDRVPVEVIPRSASPSPNHSPSLHSTDERDSSAWIPNPNNPQDYCSQVSPLQQAQAYSSRPPPVVMVPVGVLKRGGKPKREPKQVMFSDGIRPGGDLTELDLAISPEPKIPSRKTGSAGRPQRRVLEKGSPVGQLRSPQHPQSPLRASSPVGSDVTSRRSKTRSSGRVVIYDEEGPLPPIILPLSSIDLSESEDKPDSNKLFDTLQDESSKPVIFALTKNLYVSIKLVKLDCCLQKQCWVFASRGLNCVGQDEVMVVMERLPNENTLPRDIFLLFTSLYDNASMGSPVSELGHLLFPEGLLGSRDHGAFLFIRPTYQCLSKLHFPQAPYLVAVLLQKWEVPWAKVFPLRLMLRIGAEFRYYPCPLVSVRFRKPVYGEIGHTIMSVLADFRNYQYTLPTIPGVVVCMEDKKTTVSLPRNRYSQVCRVVASSNEHVLSFGAAFSIDSDSHLVCVQDDDGNYQTQAINIQNTTRKVTGASFIVFSGALKSTTGLTAKSSIVEDGLLVQITPETMIALKTSFQQMKDFVIDCGQVHAAEPEERVILKWTPDDKNFNIGVRSVIDGKTLEGVQSLRIHNGTDYSSDRFLIRWTEIFFLSNENTNQRGEPTDPSKLADGVAQAFCLALVSHLPLLVEADLTKIGLRVTLDSEQVGYEVGSKEEQLPGLYMVDLDTSLIPVINNASSGNVDSGSLTLELVFHILRK